MTYQAQDLARLGVTPSVELRIDQFGIYRHFKPTSVRRNQGDGFDGVLKLLEQLGCQANGPVGIVSDRAIDDFNFQHAPSLVLAEFPPPTARDRQSPDAGSKDRPIQAKTLENYNMQRPRLCRAMLRRYNRSA